MRGLRKRDGGMEGKWKAEKVSLRSPEMVLENPVKPLIEGPRGEVAAPVVVVAVRVREEVAAQCGKARAWLTLALVHRLEVVRQRPEPRLEVPTRILTALIVIKNKINFFYLGLCIFITFFLSSQTTNQTHSCSSV